jgi:hypothetical protein
MAGHEEGASKTAIDICLYFQQRGYVLPPLRCFSPYPWSGSLIRIPIRNISKTPLVTFKVKGIANNVVEMLLLGIEESR